MISTLEWVDVNEALPGYGEDVLLLVGWPEQRRVAMGTLNISSDGKDFGQNYWWVFSELSGQRATADYIGLPSHWARPTLPSNATGSE